MYKNTSAATGIASLRVGARIGEAIAAEGAHLGKPFFTSSICHNHAAPRTPLESP
jgi:hypothetical protein